MGVSPVIIEIKISGKIFGLLPAPETPALHHHRQESNGVIQAGHWDQGPVIFHLLHKVSGSQSKHLSAG